LGVTSLGLLARVKTSYASEHQLRVVECLEDSDETLRRKTIDLLSTMTNPANIAVVVEKLLSQLQEDVCFKSDLVNRVCSLSERFAPSNEWYLVTINQVFFLAGLDAPLPASVGDNLTRLVAEQDGVDPVTGNDLREIAANEYVVWIEKFLAATGQSTMISNQFLKLAVWMVGEFATLCSLEGYAHLDDVIDLLIDAAAKIQSESVLGCIVSAVSKLSVSASDDAKWAIRAFFHNIKSKWPLSAEIDSRCCESLYILNQPLQVQRLVLPFDAACEELDINLSFLDAFCAAARKNGAKEYSKRPTQKPQKPHIENSSLKGLRFEAYLPPQPVVSKLPTLLSPPVSSSPSSPAAQPLASPPTSATASIQLSVPGAPKRWGPPSAAAKIPQKAPPVSSQSILPKPEIISVPPTVQNLEKQRMAAALFSGVVGASPSLPYASRPKSANATRVASSVSDIDLLDLKAPASAPPPASSPDADLLDL
jgi:AP-4 complex subunit epsilon-1